MKFEYISSQETLGYKIVFFFLNNLSAFACLSLSSHNSMKESSEELLCHMKHLKLNTSAKEQHWLYWWRKPSTTTKHASINGAAL